MAIKLAGRDPYADPDYTPRRGFVFPFDIVQRGYAEWRRTGRMPDPDEIMARSPHWEQDIYWLADLVGQQEDILKPTDKS